MYNMIQKSDRDNHDNFDILENSMNNMIPIGSRIIGGFIGVFLLEIIGMSEKVPIYAYEK